MVEENKNVAKPILKSIATKQPVKTVAKPAPKQTVKHVSWKDQKRSIMFNNEVSKFTKAFRENFITLIVSALGLVAALSWNDTLKAAIAVLFPEGSDLAYKFYVSVSVTVIAVIITYFLSRIKTTGKP